jgi:hypothetical protein
VPFSTRVGRLYADGSLNPDFCSNTFQTQTACIQFYGFFSIRKVGFFFDDQLKKMEK